VATTTILLTVAQFRLRRTQDPLDTTVLDDHRLNKTTTVITATKAIITTEVAAADIWGMITQTPIQHRAPTILECLHLVVWQELLLTLLTVILAIAA
jgi:hypothetical protein